MNAKCVFVVLFVVATLTVTLSAQSCGNDGACSIPRSLKEEFARVVGVPDSGTDAEQPLLVGIVDEAASFLSGPILSDQDKSETLRTKRHFMAQLTKAAASKRLNLEFVLCDNYERLAQFLAQGIVTVGYVSPLALTSIHLVATLGELKTLPFATLTSEMEVASVCYVSKQSSISSIDAVDPASLKGNHLKFAAGPADSLFSTLLPLQYFQEHLKLEEGQHFRVKFHNQVLGHSLLGFHGTLVAGDLAVVDAVVSGEADVGCIRENLYEELKLAEKTRIVGKTKAVAGHTWALLNIVDELSRSHLRLLRSILTNSTAGENGFPKEWQSWTMVNSTTLKNSTDSITAILRRYGLYDRWLNYFASMSPNYVEETQHLPIWRRVDALLKEQAKHKKHPVNGEQSESHPDDLSDEEDKNQGTGSLDGSSFESDMGKDEDSNGAIEEEREEDDDEDPDDEEDLMASMEEDGEDDDEDSEETEETNLWA